VRAIGDEAIDTLLTMFEEVMRVGGGRGPSLRADRLGARHQPIPEAYLAG
jgi:predicted amidohydrolase YtcJ